MSRLFNSELHRFLCNLPKLLLNEEKPINRATVSHAQDALISTSHVFFSAAN